MLLIAFGIGFLAGIVFVAIAFGDWRGWIAR